ncbi:MAG: nucleotide exchange factor GrpE [Patescibacteria group bacterium]|nr:nucleotide exchange factor GrpE [Patescibacteria group bacterium]
MNDDNKNINKDIGEEVDETENGILENAPDAEEADDIVSEEDENAPNLIKKLRGKLKECEGEKNEYLDKWQRERADFINYKKRNEEENRQFVKFANERLMEEIIPVLESFEMAFSNKKVWESLPEVWRKGVEYIRSQLLSVLKNKGLEELNPPRGEKFNPNIHIAEATEPIFDKNEDSVIIRVIKKGYGLSGKIIIPPKVVVGEFSEGKIEKKE